MLYSWKYTRHLPLPAFGNFFLFIYRLSALNFWHSLVELDICYGYKPLNFIIENMCKIALTINQECLILITKNMYMVFLP